MQKNVNLSGIGKRSEQPEAGFCQAKFLRKKTRNTGTISSIFDDEIAFPWQIRLGFGLFRHALIIVILILMVFKIRLVTEYFT